jgi:hypothetical protein
MMAPPLLFIAIFVSGTFSSDIRITKNDNTPTFSRSVYVANIIENSLVGEAVTQVRATHVDHSRIQYNLDGVEDSSFRIDSTTGVIYSANFLDRETTSVYSFRVLAVDNGDPPKTGTASVTINIIDVNDNVPQFTKALYTFEVFENSASYTAIGTVTAHDRDDGKNANLKYFRYPRDKHVPFEVLRNGTVITTLQLDRETQTRYSFMVFVRDSDILFEAQISFTNVTVDIMDVNDNAPIIVFPNNFITCYLLAHRKYPGI